MGVSPAPNAIIYYNHERSKDLISIFVLLKLLRLHWKRLHLEKSLEFWQVQLHVDPQYEANKSTNKDLRSQLHIFMDRKEVGWRIWYRTKWMAYGYRMKKSFFSSIKVHLVGGLYHQSIWLIWHNGFPQVRILHGSIVIYILSCTLAWHWACKERHVVKSCLAMSRVNFYL